MKMIGYTTLIMLSMNKTLHTYYIIKVLCTMFYRSINIIVITYKY